MVRTTKMYVFFSFILCVGLLLILSTNGCTLGATGKCTSNSDCSQYIPIRLYCSRGWCVPKRVADWARKQDSGDGGTGEGSCKDQCKLGSEESCYPKNTIGCKPSGGCKGVCVLGLKRCDVGPSGCLEWLECKNAQVPQTEICDGKDNDCNGKVDDAENCCSHKIPERKCFPEGAKGCVFTRNVATCTGTCSAGNQQCKSNTWTKCQGVVLATREICRNSADEDCDGVVNNGCSSKEYGKPGVPGQAQAGVSWSNLELNSPYIMLYQQSLYILERKKDAQLIEVASPDTTKIPFSKKFNHPEGLAILSGGLFYIADTQNHVVHKFEKSGQNARTYGTLNSPGSSDGNSPLFNAPKGIAVSKDEKFIYIADSGNHTIRTLNLGGVSSTFAGKAGESGKTNGTVKDARFNSPSSLAIWKDHLYVVDQGNKLIRKINLTTKSVTTLEGEYKKPSSIAIDAKGQIIVSDEADHTLWTYNTKNKRILYAGKSGTSGYREGATTKYEDQSVPGGVNLQIHFNQPTGLLFANQILYIADTGNHTIRSIKQSY